MNRLLKTSLVSLLTFGCMNAALAKKTKPQPVAEPAFCNPKNFPKYEVPSSAPGLVRAHVFQIGDLVITGLAVGDSDITATQNLADQYSRYQESEKSCTWYFNDGNDVSLSGERNSR